MTAMWLVHNAKIQFIHHRKQFAFVRKTSRLCFKRDKGYVFLSLYGTRYDIRKVRKHNLVIAR